MQQKVSGTGSTTYAYDALDRLILLKNSAQQVSYTYDDSNRRLTKTIFNQDPSGGWQPIRTMRYLYQGQNEIGACNDAGEIVELRLLGNGKGAEISAAVAMEVDGNLYAPIHNHAGSVCCLIDPATGEAIESYSYSAFGEALFESSLIPWRFSSKRFDEESGFIYFGRRYYDPETGRWVTPDPIGREGGPNLYAYVLNSPLTHIDLYGLFGLVTHFQTP